MHVQQNLKLTGFVMI